MKKTLIILTVALLISSPAFAQEDTDIQEELSNIQNYTPSLRNQQPTSAVTIVVISRPHISIKCSIT